MNYSIFKAFVAQIRYVITCPAITGRFLAQEMCSKLFKYLKGHHDSILLKYSEKRVAYCICDVSVFWK